LLTDAQGNVVLTFAYQDKAPWPKAADGEGYTLTSVEANPTGNPSDYSYWKASSQVGGSPGTDDHPTSVERQEQLALSFKLYPSPSNGPVTLKAPGFDHQAEITIFDLSGQTLARTTLGNGETINLNEFNIKQGMYLAKIELEGRIQIQKLSIIVK